MKIFFARHGEYQNPNHVIPFRLPGFPLSELGKQQAKLQSDKLQSEKIRSLSCSPIERCMETASIIGQSIHLHPNSYPELIETLTPLQGLTKEKLSQLSPNYPYDVQVHIDGGGETPEAIFERMTGYVDKLKKMSKNSTHVIVSHGDPITIYLSGTLLKVIPHVDAQFYESKIRYIPMGGLVMLDYSQSGTPKYIEII